MACDQFIFLDLEHDILLSNLNIILASPEMSGKLVGKIEKTQVQHLNIPNNFTTHFLFLRRLRWN